MHLTQFKPLLMQFPFVKKKNALSTDQAAWL